MEAVFVANKESQTSDKMPVDAAGSGSALLHDICGVKTLLGVLILAQLLAFVLVLASIQLAGSRHGWDTLGLVSIFVHWVALTSLVSLCALRRLLSDMTPRRAAVISYIIVVLMTFIMSYLVSTLGYAAGLPEGFQWNLEFALRNMAIAAIVSAIALRFAYLHYQQKQISLAESRARIDALQARIRPHFLFNSMNTIAALIATSPEKAEEAVEDLAELFRSSMMTADKLVPLEKELETVRHYLHIESLRLGDRLKLEWQVDSLPGHALVPPLILQPLLENAVYHGIEPLAQGGTVSIRGKVVDKLIELIVENPFAADAAQQRGHGHQIALQNIRERLKYSFEGRAQLYLVEMESTIRLILSFPIRSETE